MCLVWLSALVTGPGAQPGQWGCLELQHSHAKDGRISSTAQDLWDQSFCHCGAGCL